jgi:hypothetical protein
MTDTKTKEDEARRVLEAALLDAIDMMDRGPEFYERADKRELSEFTIALLVKLSRTSFCRPDQLDDLIGGGKLGLEAGDYKDEVEYCGHLKKLIEHFSK